MKGLVLPICLLALVGVVGVVLAPAGRAAAASSAQAPAGDVSRGKTLFLTNCSLCHGPNGNGKGPNAATLNPPPANFRSPKFWSGDVPKKIQNAVKNGKGLMPPTNLSADDIRDIIAYVTQTFKPSTAEQGNTLTLFEARWSFQRESFKKSLKEVLDKRVKSYEIL